MHKAQPAAREIAGAADVVEAQYSFNFEDSFVGGAVRLVGGEG